MKKALIFLLIVATIVIGIALFWSMSVLGPREEIKKWGIVVDLQTPESGIAKISYHGEGIPEPMRGISGLEEIYRVKGIPENEIKFYVWAANLFYNIFCFGGQYFQYPYPENVVSGNGELACFVPIYRITENLLDPSVPPIRQDNVGERFCFYCYRHPHPVGHTSWWDQNYGSLTAILPVGYEIENVLTSAPEWDNVLENGRWRVTASWREGTFDKLNTPLYLEIHYRKVS